MLSRMFAYLAALALTLVLAPASAVAAGVPVEPGTATPDMFLPAEACACHSTLVDEWSKSMHAQALSDPIFNAKVAEADEATDGKLGPFCRRCHAPAAAMTGEIAAGEVTGAGTIQGVSCHWCHQVIAMKEGKPVNVSQLVDLSGTRRAQLKDPQAPHPAEYSALHETPSSAVDATTSTTRSTGCTSSRRTRSGPRARTPRRASCARTAT